MEGTYVVSAFSPVLSISHAEEEEEEEEEVPAPPTAHFSIQVSTGVLAFEEKVESIVLLSFRQLRYNGKDRKDQMGSGRI
jgi:hypothetical protein